MGVTSSKYSADELKEKRREAWTLRVKGKLIQDIANAMGEPLSTIYDWINWWAKNGDTEYGDLPAADFYRRLSLSQLQYYAGILEDKIANGDEKAIEMVMKIRTREAKLVGADAPVNVQVEHGGKVEFTINGVNTEALK